LAYAYEADGKVQISRNDDAVDIGLIEIKNEFDHSEKKTVKIKTDLK
jgi:hypothetical protein